MNATVEAKGDTLEEALEAAAAELGVEPGGLAYEVVEEGKRGVLGLRSRAVVVRAWVQAREDKAPEGGVGDEAVAVPRAIGVSAEHMEKREPCGAEEDLVDLALDAMDEILDGFDADADAEGYLDPEGNIVVEVTGPDVAGLIGRRGHTLEAIQYILGRVVSRAAGRRVRVIADAENYRARRRQALEDLAVRTARRATQSRRAMSLRPMSPAERRIIHLALAEDDRVSTHSEGEEPERHVVIEPK